MIERTILKNAMINVKIKEFLRENYRRAQISYVDIQRTPLNTRVVIYCANPRAIIGRGGRTIDSLTKKLEEDFNLFKPYVDVRYVENPWIDAAVVARRIAEELERGKRYRAVVQRYLRKIMESGAYGAEIRISGKLSGERARSEVFRIGYLKKCGYPVQENVDHAKDYVVLKPGKIGIKVSIMISLPEVSLLEKNIKGEQPVREEYYEDEAEQLSGEKEEVEEYKNNTSIEGEGDEQDSQDKGDVEKEVKEEREQGEK